MKLEHMLFIVALVLFAAAIVYNLPLPAPCEKTYESNIETIRFAQRECLHRVPAYSFSLVQSPGGYTILCELIRKAE